MSNAIYVYDNRAQYQEPLFVAYRQADVEPLLRSLFGDVPEFVVVSRQRLHPYERDRYASMGSSGVGRPRTGV